MKASAVAVAVKAASVRLGISAAVSVPAIQMAFEVGQWLIHYHRADGVSLDDGTGVLGQMFVDFFKTKTDVAGAAEDMAYLFHKDLRDDAGLSDTQIRDFFKALVDEASVLESKALAISKPLVEIVANTEDHAYLLTKKVKEDFADFSDVQVRAFFKALLDVAGVSEALATEFSKPTEDAGSAAEAYAGFLTKTLADRIVVTDDWDGQASILDDQEIIFTKGVTDIAGAFDEIYIIIEVLRDFVDAALISDATVRITSKPFNEEGVFVDTQFNVLNKGLFETPALQEFVARSLNKALADNASIADSRALATSAVKADVASFTDTGSVQNQSYGDTSYFSENYVGVFRTF